MRYTIVILAIGVSLSHAPDGGLATCAEPDHAGESEMKAKRRARMRALAESYTVDADTNDRSQVKLHEKPIFRWANPERGAIAGVAYLWTKQGRPHATIDIWTYRDIKDSHELQSLATAPFVARRNDGDVWRPQAPGVQFRPLPEAPEPSDSKKRRLTEMRVLSRKHFSARLLSSSTTRAPEKLRFLPQPIYRYEELPPNVIDGAMFSFAQGTDPEVFLLLEARKQGNRAKWYFAFAASTSVRVDGSLNGKKIWDNADQTSNRTFVMFIYPDQ